jgi:hypothetical protein
MCIIKNGVLFTGSVKNITVQRSDSTNAHLVKIHLSFPARINKETHPFQKICVAISDRFTQKYDV